MEIPNIRVPILVDHDERQVIGAVYVEKYSLMVEFLPGTKVTKQMAEVIFGGFGCLVIRTRQGTKGQIYIEKMQIMEFSLILNRAAPKPKPYL